MNDIDKIASAFRKGLIPAVAKKTPWPKMTPDSQETYRDGARTAVLALAECDFLKKMINLGWDDSQCTIEIVHDLTTLLRAIANEGKGHE